MTGNSGQGDREAAPAAIEAGALSPPSPLPAAEPLPFEFKGTGSEYFKIWIVNILLSIVTLGIYSAWAKVRRKQYFYGNTRVAGAAFRYTADPVRILKGRMVVFAGFLLYSTANRFYPPAGMVLMVALVGALPWLVVRSLVFNARNSAWRHIRFNFTGTYGIAAKVFVLFPLLALLTLGLLAPYALYRQKRFVVEHSAYGTTPFAFRAGPRDYYGIFGRLALAVVIALGISVLVVYAAKAALVALFPATVTIVLLLAGLYLYAFAFLGVQLSNLLFNSGALLRHRFRATMRVPAYAWILLTNTLGIVATLGLFHPFAKVRAHGYKMRQLALLPAGDLDRFVAAEVKEVSALGDELSDFMDFDFGI